MIFDTSPLQALHRCDALRLLATAYEHPAVPKAVFQEMVASLATTGPTRVPDLAAHPAIEVVDVSADIEASDAVLVRDYRSTTRYQWRGRKLERPELEAILLAKRVGRPLVIEDDLAAKCAREVGVDVWHTAKVLVDLEKKGLFDDADARAKRVLDTGYFIKELDWLSRRAYP